MKALAALIIFLSTFGAWGSYKQSCLEQLHVPLVKNKIVNEMREQWLNDIHEATGIEREISDIELEAWLDITSGLFLYAKFSDDRQSLFKPDMESLDKITTWLETASIVEVVYAPESLKLMGKILRLACEIAGRPNCETYVQYFGLSDKNGRPFTVREERALKWATFHMMPGEPVIGDINRTSRNRKPFVTSYHQWRRLLASRELLFGVFGNEEAERIYQQFVTPMISAAYARVLHQSEGRSIQ